MKRPYWAFREQLSKAGIERALFSRFERFLQRRGLKTKEGSIVDATLVEVPIRRDSKEDNDAVKAGAVPPSISENPNAACQKDLDRGQDAASRGARIWLDDQGDGREAVAGDWASQEHDRHSVDESGIQHESVFKGVLCTDVREKPFWAAEGLQRGKRIRDESHEGRFRVRIRVT